MRGHRGWGRRIGLTLVAALLLSACGDAVDEVGDAIEEVDDEPVEETLETVEDEAAAEATDEPDGNAGESEEVEDEVDPFEPGTVLEATYVVDFVGPGPVPCPQVELDNGQRIGVLSTGFRLNDDGRPTEPGYLIDVEGNVLLVQPEDWVDFGVPEGELIASEGDRVRLTSAGSMPLEIIGSRDSCGDPQDELLVFQTIEAIS